MTDRENPETLDRNLAALLRQAPTAAAAPDDVRERVFNRVLRRLEAQRQRRRIIWISALAAAAAVLLAVASALRPWQGGSAVAPVSAPAVLHEAALVLTAAADKAKEHSLADGSVLVLSPDSQAIVKNVPGKARPDVTLEKGEVLCRVAKGKERFVLRTPAGQVTALGTEFTARLTPASPERRAALALAVSVISGQVLVSDNIGREYLAAAGDKVRVGAPETPQPKDDWQSAVLVARLQDGRQGEPLEVRRHSVNVTIHDQLALVEVDEVFYNPSDERLEGTFFFPLPPGATLCRLAMYVGDRLMEGELAEARRARRTFEALKVQRIDP
ncbi:MAG: VIT domain-containing protein, partial [Planctomycetota bacterium]|nr:VIT domain-containing protein [Planctomycetota bacterium]